MRLNGIWNYDDHTSSDCAHDRYNLVFVLCKVILFKAAELNLSTLNTIRTLEV